MKKKDIIACLKANKNISDYEVIISDKDSRELFYVLDHLEINRAVKVETVSIRIYVSNKKTTGSSTVTVTAADDRKSLSQKLSKAVGRAKAARNAYYPLCEKTTNIKETKSAAKDLNKIATNVAEAVLKADTYKDGWINSTEIFVSQFREEFINSRGVDHVSDRFKVEIECIPTWSNGKDEYELYKFYESNVVDYKQITKEIKEILDLAKDRSVAKTIKQVKIPQNIKVLVKNDMLETIVDNLANDLSYSNVYMKQNHYQKKDIVSDNKFELTMKGSVKGCCASRKYDGHGVILRSRNLIRDGVVKNNYGDLQFGYYLNEKNISGKLPVAQIKAKGTSTYKKEKHLIIENFSSPQLEENSGYWGGEVRLARYFDGEKYIPLTGFSIAGSIYEDLKNVEFSKEETITSKYAGPKYMIFSGLKIS